MAGKQPEVTGEKLNEWATAFLGYIMAGLRALMFLAFPVVAIGADLYLSGAFMNGYSQQYGSHGVITSLLPWIFTLSTTGLQGAINQRSKNGGFRKERFGTKFVMVVGWGLIFLDTLTDLGGWTALYTGDINQGANILPPNWQHDPWWGVMAVMVVLICGGQEKILPLLYGKWKDSSVLSGHDDEYGAKLIRIGVAAGGATYNVITAVLKVVGLISVLLLDVVLAPSFLGHATGTPAAWVISFLLTGFGWLLWRFADKVAFAPMRDGGRGWSQLDNGAKGTAIVAGLIALADAVLDVAGYTALVYGDKPGVFLVPPVISSNWIITAVIVFIACLAGDVMITRLLSKPGDGGEASASSPDPWSSSSSTDESKGTSGSSDSGWGDDDSELDW
jgi:hypothetical protein